MNKRGIMKTISKFRGEDVEVYLEELIFSQTDPCEWKMWLCQQIHLKTWNTNKSLGQMT